MADSITIYHGSNVVVNNPQIIVSGFYKDFGFGFYCTNIEKQAKKWALSKRGNSIVSVFDYQPAEDLKILSFPVMTDEWLDFVVACRRGTKHDYDIVEGPMADDQIWEYVQNHGFNTIELMPVMKHVPGHFYHILDFFALDDTYGS